MITTPKADALEALARTLKALDDQIQVYLLPSDPEGTSPDPDLHVAVLADVDVARLSALNEPIAEAMEEANIEVGYDPFVVAHPTNRNDTLAKTARQNGVRL